MRFRSLVISCSNASRFGCIPVFIVSGDVQLCRGRRGRKVSASILSSMNDLHLGADVYIGFGVIVLLLLLVLWHSGKASPRAYRGVPRVPARRAGFSGGKPGDPNWADHQSFYMPYFDNYYGAYYDPYYGPEDGWRGPSLGPEAYYGVPPRRTPPPAATCNTLCENGVPC